MENRLHRARHDEGGSRTDREARPENAGAMKYDITENAGRRRSERDSYPKLISAWTGPGKGAVGLQGPARQALLSNPTHPLTYDPGATQVSVDVVAAPYNRVDLDYCSIAQLQSL